jgi:hypothetical protein
MDARYIISQNGRQFVRFEGLLLAAHEAGLAGVETRLVQAPAEGNQQTAIVLAEVQLAKGVFTALGDASPASVARHLAPHVVRMAETRALARAFRFGLGVAAVAVEELGDVVDEPTPAPRACPERREGATPATMPARAPAPAARPAVNSARPVAPIRTS